MAESPLLCGSVPSPVAVEITPFCLAQICKIGCVFIPQHSKPFHFTQTYLKDSENPSLVPQGESRGKKLIKALITKIIYRMLDGIQLGAVKDRKCKDIAKSVETTKNKEPSENQTNTSDLFFNWDDKIIYANAEKTEICNKNLFFYYRET
uniref:Uncharacterized protein n=1 Tax=Calidris pygmaea TaxID=425635 RepID=A0A8C3KKY5_9CHAR